MFLLKKNNNKKTIVGRSICFFCAFAGVKMNIMKDAQSHISSLSYIAPYTSLHTQVSRNPAIFSVCTFYALIKNVIRIRLVTCVDVHTKWFWNAAPRRSRVICSARRGGTGGITHQQNSILSLLHIMGHTQTHRTVSAITCRRSADPGPPHRQKMVRCGFYTLNIYINKHVQTYNYFVQGFSYPSIPTLQSPNHLFTPWTQTVLWQVQKQPDLMTHWRSLALYFCWMHICTQR